jgi:hypothetical protein
MPNPYQNFPLPSPSGKIKAPYDERNTQSNGQQSHQTSAAFKKSSKPHLAPKTEYFFKEMSKNSFTFSEFLDFAGADKKAVIDAMLTKLDSEKNISKFNLDHAMIYNDVIEKKLEDIHDIVWPDLLSLAARVWRYEDGRQYEITNQLVSNVQKYEILDRLMEENEELYTSQQIDRLLFKQNKGLIEGLATKVDSEIDWSSVIDLVSTLNHNSSNSFQTLSQLKLNFTNDNSKRAVLIQIRDKLAELYYKHDISYSDFKVLKQFLKKSSEIINRGLIGTISWESLLKCAEYLEKAPSTYVPTKHLLESSRLNFETLSQELRTHCYDDPELDNFLQEITDEVEANWSEDPNFLSDVEQLYDLAKKYKNYQQSQIVLAEMEVVAQELQRLLCPTHCLDGYNIFPKYRVGFNDEMISEDSPVFVATKRINFIGEFYFDAVRGQLQLGVKDYEFVGGDTFKAQKQVCDISGIKGLGASALLARLLGDIDTKVGNIGLQVHGVDAHNDPIITFARVDGGCFFAGYANPDFVEQKWRLGPITAADILENPGPGTMKFYNYLSSMSQGTVNQEQTEALKSMADHHQLQKETMVTSLRFAFLPTEYQDCFLSDYCSSSVSSQKLKSNISSYLEDQKTAVLTILATEAKCQNYFFSPQALNQGVLFHELELLHDSLTTFKTHGKNKPADKIPNFTQSFVDSITPGLIQMLSHQSVKNKKIFLENLQKEILPADSTLFKRLLLQKIKSHPQMRSLVETTVTLNPREPLKSNKKSGFMGLFFKPKLISPTTNKTQDPDGLDGVAMQKEKIKPKPKNN